MPRGFPVKALRLCKTTHAVESTLPFKKETGNERDNSTMDSIAGYGCLLSEHPLFEHLGLILDVTITNPSVPSALDVPVDIAGSPVAQVISRTPAPEGEIYDVREPAPLSFYTCGECSVDLHSLLKDLIAKLRAERYHETLPAADKTGLIARETGEARRELSYGARVC